MQFAYQLVLRAPNLQCAALHCISTIHTYMCIHNKDITTALHFASCYLHKRSKIFTSLCAHFYKH